MSPLLVIPGILFGAVFGSFATVLVARVPSASSIGGRSACPACGTRIGPLDNIPIVSWCLLRGRCRACKAPIAWTYPAIEAITAGLFVLVLWQQWPLPQTLAWLWFAPIATALAFIDLEHFRLPNALTWSALLGCSVLLAANAVISGDRDALRGAAIGAIGLSAFYLFLNIVSRGGMGMGDVKLALTIGLLTGYSGWPFVVTATFTAFVLGSIVGIALMLTGRAGRKSALPFGPFMLVGVFLAPLLTDAMLGPLLVF